MKPNRIGKCSFESGKRYKLLLVQLVWCEYFLMMFDSNYFKRECHMQKSFEIPHDISFTMQQNDSRNNWSWKGSRNFQSHVWGSIAPPPSHTIFIVKCVVFTRNWMFAWFALSLSFFLASAKYAMCECEWWKAACYACMYFKEIEMKYCMNHRCTAGM